MNTEYVHTWGIYPWFPDDDEQLVFDADREKAKHVSMYCKVFECIAIAEPYIVLRYGQTTVRVLPLLYQPVTASPFRIGDSVEILNKPGTIGVIRDMIWHYKNDAIMYFLTSVTGKKLSKNYWESDIAAIKS